MMTVLTLTDIPSWLSALKWPYHEIILPTASFVCVCVCVWVGVGVGDGEMSDVWLRFVVGMARLHNLEVFAIWYNNSRRLVSRPRCCSDLYLKIWL
jgi:hypothetical protein